MAAVASAGTTAGVIRAFKLRGLQPQSDAVDLVVRQLKYQLDADRALAAILEGVRELLERSKSASRAGPRGAPAGCAASRQLARGRARVARRVLRNRRTRVLQDLPTLNTSSLPPCPPLTTSPPPTAGGSAIVRASHVEQVIAAATLDDSDVKKDAFGVTGAFETPRYRYDASRRAYEL